MKDVLWILGVLSVGCASAPASEPASPPPADPAGATQPAGPEVPGSPKVSADGSCGGLQGLACAAGQYCFFSLEATCGAADQMGRCTPIPEMCTEQFAPVCGCNDKTYPNDCYAAREGISVGRKGECPK